MPKLTIKRRNATHQETMQEIKARHVRELLSLPEIEKQEPKRLRAPVEVPPHKIEARRKDSLSLAARVRKEIVSGQVYVIRMGETSFYKIGCLARSGQVVDRRLEILQIGNPVKLSLIFVIAVEYPFAKEGILHDKFQSKWIRGEWFDLSAEDVAMIPDLLLSLTEWRPQLLVEEKRA